MNIHIPPSLASMAPQLQDFFDTMVFKLSVNSHKNAVRDDDIDGLLDKMAAEVQEFKDQRLVDADDPNNLEELGDCANFAFLLYAYLRARGVKDMRERFIEEYFDIHTQTGRVFCKKTRSGSPLKVGDEIRGTVRNGQTFIRTQHAITGATISVARADLIWWKAHGRWPIGRLRHWNGVKSNDSLKNLDEVPLITKGAKYPFVFRHAPRGRENTENFGKFGYQRRHAFNLIRVGYWDTEEEAARLGLIAWKEKTRGPV